jgi:hypothetical protein
MMSLEILISLYFLKSAQIVNTERRTLPSFPSVSSQLSKWWRGKEMQERNYRPIYGSGSIHLRRQGVGGGCGGISHTHRPQCDRGGACISWMIMNKRDPHAVRLEEVST